MALASSKAKSMSYSLRNEFAAGSSTQMEKSQREYYLNEQMKAIQKELGDMEDAPNDLEDLANRRSRESGMPKEAREEGNIRAEQAQDDVPDVSRSDCCSETTSTGF